MNIGRTGQHQCDQCSRVLIPPFAVVPLENGKVVRLCRDTECLVEFFLEGPMKERAEKEARRELKQVHDQVCPACRARLRTLI